MSMLVRIYAIMMVFLRPAIRQPVMTVLVSMLPISFIVIFRLIGGSELSTHALYGTLIVFATNVGVVTMPQLAVAYQVRNLQDIYVASPVTPLMYAAGMGLSRLAWVAPGLVIILGILLATGGMPAAGLPSVIVVLLVTWFTGVMIGFTTATFFSTGYLVGTVANFLGMLLSVLPPVYYPLSYVPTPWRWLALALPTTNAAELVRLAGGVSQATPQMVTTHWVVLLGFAGLGATITAYKARWREV